MGYCTWEEFASYRWCRLLAEWLFTVSIRTDPDWLFLARGNWTNPCVIEHYQIPWCFHLNGSLRNEIHTCGLGQGCLRNAKMVNFLYVDKAVQKLFTSLSITGLGLGCTVGNRSSTRNPRIWTVAVGSTGKGHSELLCGYENKITRGRAWISINTRPVLCSDWNCNRNCDRYIKPFSLRIIRAPLVLAIGLELKMGSLGSSLAALRGGQLWTVATVDANRDFSQQPEQSFP